MSKTCLLCGETFPDAATFCPRDGSALRATVTGDDLIGELFCERYVATDLLGEGGMAAVYLARDVRLPQQVAIKVLRDAGTTDPSVVRRFRHEAEAASRINHDRVARVTDFGFMTDGRAFLVMEYVNGRTLRQLLDARGTLSFSETAAIVHMIAEGLNAAHRLGIVHRDLKPENVMVVEEDDGSVRVKVLDFGIAKLLEDSDAEGKTAPGFAIGTPKWMSPEQLLGQALDARSDVYSLALLAFSMLTGARAFVGSSEQEEMLARLSAPAREFIEVRPDIAWPAPLQALFSRTLVRDPAVRPESAVAFARELRRIIDGPSATMAFTPPTLASALLAQTEEPVLLAQTEPRPAAVQSLDVEDVPPPDASLADRSDEAEAEADATTRSVTRSTLLGETTVGSEARLLETSTSAFSTAAPAARSDDAVQTTVELALAHKGRRIPLFVLVGAIAAILLIAVVLARREPAAPRVAATNADPSAAAPAASVADTAFVASPTAARPGTPAQTDAMDTTRPLTKKPDSTMARARASGGTMATAPVRSPTSAPVAVSRDTGDTKSRVRRAADSTTRPKAATARDERDSARAPRLSAEAEASIALTTVISDAQADLTSRNESTRRARARSLIRDVQALLPRLHNGVELGWASLYLGTSYAILGDKSKACTLLAQATAGAATPATLRENRTALEKKLRCEP